MRLAGLPVHSSAAEDAARVLDGDPPLPFLDDDDHVEQPDYQHAQQETAADSVTRSRIELTSDVLRQSTDDAREDEDGDAVSDPALADQLSQPDQEHRARGHGDDHGEGGQGLRTTKANAGGAGEPALALHEHELSVPLDQGHGHGHPVRVYLDLAPPLFALLGERLPGGHQGHHELHDDGRWDVRG